MKNGNVNQRSTPEGAEVKGLKSRVLSTPSASLVHPVSGGQSAGEVLALLIVRSLWIPRA